MEEEGEKTRGWKKKKERGCRNGIKRRERMQKWRKKERERGNGKERRGRWEMWDERERRREEMKGKEGWIKKEGEGGRR